MKTIDKFLIIDDDPTATMLYSLILKLALGDKIDIRSFNLPEEGVTYINKEFKKPEAKSRTILFLDINMPILTGWDVVDLIDKMDETIKKQLIIFMLSSSVVPKDKTRAMDHPLITDFIEKPLTVDKIKNILAIES